MVKTAFISLLFSDDPCKVKVSSLLIQGLNFLTFRPFCFLRCRANAPCRLYPTVWVKGSGDEMWLKIEHTTGGNSLYNKK